MNPTNTPQNTLDSPSTSAGDAAALQAIEALEAETNILPDEPSAIATPPITEPATSVPDPLPPAQSVVDTPPAVPPMDSIVTPEIAPVTPQTGPAADMAQSLSQEAPVASASTDFQPFAEQKKHSKKPLIILVIVLGVILLGAGGYFGWQYWQSMNAPATVIVTPDEGTPAEQTPVDSEDSVISEIEQIETSLDNVDDSEYQEGTLSNESLAD